MKILKTRFLIPIKFFLLILSSISTLCGLDLQEIVNRENQKIPFPSAYISWQKYNIVRYYTHTCQKGYQPETSIYYNHDGSKIFGKYLRNCFQKLEFYKDTPVVATPKNPNGKMVYIDPNNFVHFTTTSSTGVIYNEAIPSSALQDNATIYSLQWLNQKQDSILSFYASNETEHYLGIVNTESIFNHLPNLCAFKMVPPNLQTYFKEKIDQEHNNAFSAFQPKTLIINNNILGHKTIRYFQMYEHNEKSYLLLCTSNIGITPQENIVTFHLLACKPSFKILRSVKLEIAGVTTTTFPDTKSYWAVQVVEHDSNEFFLFIQKNVGKTCCYKISVNFNLETPMIWYSPINIEHLPIH